MPFAMCKSYHVKTTPLNTIVSGAQPARVLTSDKGEGGLNKKNFFASFWRH